MNSADLILKFEEDKMDIKDCFYLAKAFIAEGNTANMAKLMTLDEKSVNIGDNFSPVEQVIPFSTAFKLCLSLFAIFRGITPPVFGDEDVFHLIQDQ